MNTEKSPFNRNLVIILMLLFLVTQAAISYPSLENDPGQREWWQILLNMLLLSIPVVLLYGSLYIVIVAWREHALSGQVKPRLAKIIYWAPRVAAIGIIGFVSIFSLDVFNAQASPFELLGSFLIHNIPSIAMIALLVFAWKRPMVGFVAFLIAGGLFGFLFLYDFYNEREAAQ